MDASDHGLNLIGISFEIVGFLIILPHIKRWMQKRIHKLAEEAEESLDEFIGIHESHEVVTNTVTHFWRKLENIGIPLVIIGLLFQGLSTIFHS